MKNSVRRYLRVLALAIFAFAASPAASGQRAAKFEDNTENCAKPAWPYASLRDGEQGTVSLRLQVNEDGTVAEAKVVKSSGFSLLDAAARDTLALCKFKPKLQDGEPVKDWINLNYQFVLDPSDPTWTAARRGADHGNSKAQYALAMLYLDETKKTYHVAEGIRWLRRSAALNNPQAQHALGAMLIFATRVTKEPDAGMALLRQASAQNYVPSHTLLGMVLIADQASASEKREGAALLQRGAAGGDAQAQYLLGVCYEKGLGVAQDFSQAKSLYYEAALAGHKNAQSASERLSAQHTE